MWGLLSHYGILKIVEPGRCFSETPGAFSLFFVYCRFLFSPFLIISGRAQESSPALSKIVIKLMCCTLVVPPNKRVSHRLPCSQEKSSLLLLRLREKAETGGWVFSSRPNPYLFSQGFIEDRTPKSQLAFSLQEYTVMPSPPLYDPRCIWRCRSFSR